MKLTLSAKLTIGYLVFALISFLLVMLAAAPMLESYLIREDASALYDSAQGIATRIAESGNDTADADTIITRLAPIPENHEVNLWVLSPSGEVIFDKDGKRTGEIIAGFDPAESSDFYRTGLFYNMFEEEMLSVLAPVTINFQVTEYVTVHMSTANLLQVRDGIMNIMYITLLLLLLIALIALIFFYRSFIRPLRQINYAAAEYAAGNLGHVIPIHRRDEIGGLATTLNGMVAELNKNEEFQREFISNISHDFRSPLTSIRGYLVAMQDGTIPPEMQGKYLDIVINETDRLAGLTQRMLTLNSLHAENALINPVYFDLHDVIRKTCASFEGVCRQKQLRFELNFEVESEMVYADKEKIQQVLYNLIDNAIKFSYKDSAIYIRTREVRDKVFVQVRDTGQGIPKESLPQIWNRFYKSDTSRGKDKSGTGLGLAIVKDIITAHNEQIDCISTEGIGTEFVFRLPKKL